MCQTASHQILWMLLSVHRNFQAACLCNTSGSQSIYCRLRSCSVLSLSIHKHIKLQLAADKAAQTDDGDRGYAPDVKRDLVLSYLQKAGGSSVPCCEITYLPLGRLTSIKPKIHTEQS